MFVALFSRHPCPTANSPPFLHAWWYGNGRHEKLFPHTTWKLFTRFMCLLPRFPYTFFTLTLLSSFQPPLPLVHLGCFLIFRLHSNTKYSLLSHKFNLKVPNLLLINYINDCTLFDLVKIKNALVDMLWLAEWCENSLMISHTFATLKILKTFLKILKFLFIRAWENL